MKRFTTILTPGILGPQTILTHIFDKRVEFWRIIEFLSRKVMGLKYERIKYFMVRGHPHMISDFGGPFLTYLPTHIRFSPNLKCTLDTLYPIFINLPTYPKIGYHMWMTPMYLLNQAKKHLLPLALYFKMNFQINIF